MRTLRLVEKMPIFDTVQGEGILVGQPSTFLRLHGCDLTCAWCDTKDSWRDGSKWTEMAQKDVRDTLSQHKANHLVITGGNPVLQGDALAEFFGKNQLWFRNQYQSITLETNATAFDKELLSQMAIFSMNSWKGRLALLSLSPKLHVLKSDSGHQAFFRWWIEQVIAEAMVMNSNIKIQMKLVVSNPEEIKEALSTLYLAEEKTKGVMDLSCILQPEYAAMTLTKNKENPLTKKCIEECILAARGFRSLRVIPQMHKAVYGVP